MTDEAPKSTRGNVQDKVLSQLRYGIMSGMFVPGQVFSLRKLAAVFGTSPMPVRESLSRLIAANALEELPNRSVGVPRLSAESLVELYELRVRVEGLAIRIATQRATTEDVSHLRAINETLKEAHDTGNMSKVLEINQKFHFFLYGLTGSSILLPIIEGLWLRCGPTMYFSLSTPKLWDTSSHIDILYALEKRDPDAAEEAMRKDIMTSGAFLIEQAQKGVRTGPIADFAGIFGDN
jgi:DNA-binding GntR family transcriptional regulator